MDSLTDFDKLKQIVEWAREQKIFLSRVSVGGIAIDFVDMGGSPLAPINIASGESTTVAMGSRPQDYYQFYAGRLPKPASED
jgi:hypothetical protein